MLRIGLPVHLPNASPSPPPLHFLTPRELDVLRLLGRGLDNPTIAARLLISPHTLHRHIMSIYAKLGGASRPQAILYAIRHQLADPNDADP
jgi:DNA-binding NarL/FixJ family response regulator